MVYVGQTEVDHYCTLAGCCRHCNEPFIAMKYGVFGLDSWIIIAHWLADVGTVMNLLLP